MLRTLAFTFAVLCGIFGAVILAGAPDMAWRFAGIVGVMWSAIGVSVTLWG